MPMKSWSISNVQPLWAGSEAEPVFPKASATTRRAEQWPAGDGCQRPLVPRSRCPPRLTPSVRLQQACHEIPLEKRYHGLL